MTLTTPSPISDQAAGEPRDIALQAVLDAFANYERFGEICPFEGSPMIYAETLVELADLARIAMDMKSTAPTTGSASDAEGYAFKCDGKLWVVTDPDVAMKWQSQGFAVTPVTASPAASVPLDVENVLCNVAQILDTVKMEWSTTNSWSEWDQSVRDSISVLLAASIGGEPK